MSSASSYFVWNRRRDWELGKFSNLSVTEEGLALKESLHYAVSQVIPLGGILPGDAKIADAAANAEGRIYLLDRRGGIYRLEVHSRQYELILPPGHGMFGRGAMLAAGDRCLFVADRSGYGRLLAISPSNGQVLWDAEGTEHEPVYPLAVAADSRDRVCLVTPSSLEEQRSTPADEAPIPSGRHRKLFFVPQGAGIRVVRFLPAGRKAPHDPDADRLAVIAGDTPARALHGRWHASFSGESDLYVLDAQEKKLYRFPDSAVRVSVGLPAGPGQLTGFTADPAGDLYTCTMSTQVDGRTPQALIQAFSPEGELQHTIVSLQGTPERLLTHPGGSLYVLDWNASSRESGMEGELVAELRRVPHYSESTGTQEYSGVYACSVCDSREAGTPWHKIRMEAKVPVGTQVEVYYHAADEPLPTGELLYDPAGQWRGPIVNLKDALLHHAVGRYLHLRIKLLGSKRQTPVVSGLRVQFSQRSLLDDLPAVYQEDEAGRDFLHRYLSLFGTFLDDMEASIDGLASYADPHSAEGEFLEWLGRWVGITNYSQWTEEELRQYILKSPELYARRGTRAGLEAVLSLFLDAPPVIVEAFQLRSLLEHPELEELVRELHGEGPYSFTVLLRPGSVRSEERQRLIRDLIADHTPAYTQARLVFLENGMGLDQHTYLGVNSRLEHPERLRLDQEGVLTSFLQLPAEEPDSRLDHHTRLDLDAQLE
ncbi:phage tail-like protein [Paenibacillus mucilaginosus]|uniref:phage tail protein n=1 Tax=Paenibacillus mucilaginosus TaxID=61624 RepID=UPI003D1F7BAD